MKDGRMRGKMLAFMTILGCMGCAPLSTDNHDVPPPVWSMPENHLSAYLDFDREVVAGETRDVRLFIRADESMKRPVRLIAGMFVFTIVPFMDPTNRENDSTHYPFSGGGGIDYTGRTPITYKIHVPTKAGRYMMFGIIVSTREDVDYFRMTAKMKHGIHTLWVGTLSTPPVIFQVKERI